MRLGIWILGFLVTSVGWADFYWKVPPELDEKRIEKLLQAFTDATHGKAFRYLGVEHDFFHGHILYDADKKARAILYHTQEDAYDAHWRGTVDKKFDYVNVTTRNWIQWLDAGEKIENARVYQDPRWRPAAQFWDEKAAPQENLHYTIHSHEMDPEKLGFRVVEMMSLNFYEDDCAGPRDDYYRMRRGPIQVRVPKQGEVCLSLSTPYTMVDLSDHVPPKR